MKYLKCLASTLLLTVLSACQWLSPLFIEYNGVRRDVAHWINQQTVLSMQKKRSLAQLSKAQQKLVNIDIISNDSKLSIAKENLIAMHCAQLHVANEKIVELQNQVFGETEKNKILEKFNQNFPQLKLDVNSIHCD